MFEMCMGKIKLCAKLISDNDDLVVNTLGIKLDNKVIYRENDIQVTLLIENNKIIMKRMSSEYTIELIFDKNNNTLSTYSFIGGNKHFNLNTNTREMIINDTKIEIKYILEGNKYYYILEMEEV